MPNPNRVTADEWISSFSKATNDSQLQDPGLFDSMMQSLSGSKSGRFWQIQLDTSGLRGAEYAIVESAVRRAFNDKRSDHHPDAIFNGVEVEVKHKPKVFTSFPNDSYGLSDRTDKWYLFVMGSVDGTKSNTFSAWLMRSKELFLEVMIRRGHMTPGAQTGHGQQYSKLYIDPNSSTALEEIESQIEEIKKSLAASIVKKAKGVSRKSEDPSMSLSLPIGANRVRFEIKFESLLKSYVGEIIND